MGNSLSKDLISFAQANANPKKYFRIGYKNVPVSILRASLD